MKILLDAQLPQSLVKQLEPMGCNVLHTLDLPEGNRSSGRTISFIADHDGRVVFSKDADFIQSHLLRGSPARLLIVATGNIRNQELVPLLIGVLPELIRLFESHVLIELSRKALIVRHRGAPDSPSIRWAPRLLCRGMPLPVSAGAGLAVSWQISGRAVPGASAVGRWGSCACARRCTRSGEGRQQRGCWPWSDAGGCLAPGPDLVLGGPAGHRPCWDPVWRGRLAAAATRSRVWLCRPNPCLALASAAWNLPRPWDVYTFGGRTAWRPVLASVNSGPGWPPIWNRPRRLR
ncbi:DUF5615 family PIN-like protein [Cyanobium sp. Cruz-8D1]|nr:DUF5615 family PIN-like protein [Cyanobium sp. Cruz-8H5]MCP9868239.1 DUF5615 family PIN-like protein [Cyanobium sp. Cruz-8D1]